MSRIFIAINLPEHTKKELENLKKEIQDLFAEERAGETNEIDEIVDEDVVWNQNRGVVRWVKNENLHLTLIFIGTIKESQITQLTQIVGKTIQFQTPFFLKFKKVCYGPSGIKPPRLIWVELEKEKKLLKLVEGLQKELFGVGILGKCDKRKFSPHITLARINAWQWRQIEPEERPEINEEINISFEVNSIEVMESQLKRTGPNYIILESCPLGKDL
jgi:2'-5' RNA ligase